MNELDVIYGFQQAVLKAEGVGLSLRTTRVDYVLRDDSRGHQEFARCSTLTEVNEALDRRAQMLRQD